ncbi:hypothetical protein RHSIM_Rhsim08G0055800 [Rhododendron simsii]|uniref:RING-type domain-containing protein n=1 Tax=Rhododendron simsii TaxID=118357 RepID=A0A834GGP5_RHOSS|nr:hypothetical protein RHSIM_Rhsim08G0055800 [Rhododendron simsii]
MDRGSFGSRSMSQSDIENLPCFDFKARVEGSSPVDCAVCLENFKVGDKCRLLPLCKHSFHAQCVDLWLLKTPICPVCRTRTASGRSTEIGDSQTGDTDHLSDSGEVGIEQPGLRFFEAKMSEGLRLGLFRWARVGLTPAGRKQDTKERFCFSEFAEDDTASHESPGLNCVAEVARAEATMLKNSLGEVKSPPYFFSSRPNLCGRKILRENENVNPHDQFFNFEGIVKQIK